MYSCSDIAQTVHLLCTVQEANERGRVENGAEKVDQRVGAFIYTYGARRNGERDCERRA